MLVIIKGQELELQVTTVTLAHDLEDPEGFRLRMFFCPNCRAAVLQYKGHIASIEPGLSPVKLPTLIRCPNTICRGYYFFKSLE